MVAIAGTTLRPFRRELLTRLSWILYHAVPPLSKASPYSRPTLLRSLGTQTSPSLSAISSKSNRIRCTEIDKHGGTTTRYISFRKSELTTICGLMPRDIRKLAASTLSHIRIRPSTMLLHLFHLKVLVQQDRILLFDDAISAASRASFLCELRERIGHRGTAPTAEAEAVVSVQQEGHRQQHPSFKFHATEAVLSSAVSELEVELEALRISAERVLKSVEDDVNSRTLITLLDLDNKVVQFAKQAELARTAVETVLDRDDRLAALYVPAQAASDVAGKTSNNDLTIAELLLGSYYIAYNEIVQEAQNLVSGIRHTKESASAMLDSKRNTMMLLDLKFRLGTLGLATGAMFSAFYGMNISNYIREYIWAFPAVSGTSATLFAASLCYGLLVLRKLVSVRMRGHGGGVRKRLKQATWLR